MIVNHKKNPVLNGVNFLVNKGDFVYIIGKTGSGKSSILKLLYKELEAAEGEVNVLDFDLRKIKSSKVPFLRRKLGIVFQDFQLLPDRNIENNLLFVMHSTNWGDKKMMGVMRRVFKRTNLGSIQKIRPDPQNTPSPPPHPARSPPRYHLHQGRVRGSPAKK